MEVGLHRIPTRQRRGDAVDGFLLLALEGAEEPVPDDQRTRVVAVDVLGVAPVVHAVVARRVQHRFQRTEVLDRLGVDPELVQRVEGPHGDDEQRMDAKDRER